MCSLTRIAHLVLNSNFFCCSIFNDQFVSFQLSRSLTFDIILQKIRFVNSFFEKSLYFFYFFKKHQKEIKNISKIVIFHLLHLIKIRNRDTIITESKEKSPTRTKFLSGSII